MPGLCYLYDLPEHVPTLIGDIVLFRSGHDCSGYQALCPHAGKPLGNEHEPLRLVTDFLIECPAHGALFTPITGECISGPCLNSFLSVVKLAITPAGEIFLAAEDD